MRDANTPVVSLAFAFEGGAAVDPNGKDGLANLVSTLLDEGAGKYNSDEFHKQLENNSISLSFGADYDAFYGRMRTLTETEDKAFELLQLALTAPRFDDDAVARMRKAVEATIRQEEQSPGWIAGDTLRKQLFANHPYSRRTDGSLKTLAAITKEDMRKFVHDRLALDNLKIAVSGDITSEKLAAFLDKTFGALPHSSAVKQVTEITPETKQSVIVVKRPTTQSIMLIGNAGIKRNDPDWYAASILNYALGGESLSSRLMTEIREKRGLTYGSRSSLVPLKYSAFVVANASTANASAKQVLELLQGEWQKIANGVTEKELEAAKSYLNGNFPLQFESTGDTASILLQMQRDNLGIDYLDRRKDLINAVTLKDTKRVAKRLFKPEAAVVIIVGQPKDIVPTSNN